MILRLKNNATDSEINLLENKLIFMGFDIYLCSEKNQKTIAIIGGIDKLTHLDLFSEMSIVDKILPLKKNIN